MAANQEEREPPQHHQNWRSEVDSNIKRLQSLLFSTESALDNRDYTSAHLLSLGLVGFLDARSSNDVDQAFVQPIRRDALSKLTTARAALAAEFDRKAFEGAGRAPGKIFTMNADIERIKQSKYFRALQQSNKGESNGLGRMREAARNVKVPQFILRIQLVQKRSIMHYQQQLSHPFLKIVVALPNMVATCRGILDRGIHIDGLGSNSFTTYESNVLFALRFMIDCNIVGGNWIEVPAGKYKKTSKNLSTCQLEFDCLYTDLISHAPEGEFSKMAPFCILSFDIECAGRKGVFPQPMHDPVIQVANLVTIQGKDQPFVQNVMTLKSCAPIAGAEVMSFESERELLLAWRDFIREIDPDIIIGYNICNFDLPYLIQSKCVRNWGVSYSWAHKG